MQRIFELWNPIFDAWTVVVLRERLLGVKTLAFTGREETIELYDMFENGRWKYKKPNDGLDALVSELNSLCVDLSIQINMPDIRKYLEPAMFVRNGRENFRSFFAGIAGLLSAKYPISEITLNAMIKATKVQHSPEKVRIASPRLTEEYVYDKDKPAAEIKKKTAFKTTI